MRYGKTIFTGLIALTAIGGTATTAFASTTCAPKADHHATTDVKVFPGHKIEPKCDCHWVTTWKRVKVYNCKTGCWSWKWVATRHEVCKPRPKPVIRIPVTSHHQGNCNCDHTQPVVHLTSDHHAKCPPKVVREPVIIPVPVKCPPKVTIIREPVKCHPKLQPVFQDHPVKCAPKIQSVKCSPKNGMTGVPGSSPELQGHFHNGIPTVTGALH